MRVCLAKRELDSRRCSVATAATWTLAGGWLAVVLLWPAIYNRYPLIYMDTANYMYAALISYHPSLRSLAYSLFLVGASAGRWGWGPAIAQSFMTAALLLVSVDLSTDRLRRGALTSQARRIVLVTTIATLASVGSSLPAYVSLLNPDIYTVLGALGCFVSWFAPTGFRRRVGLAAAFLGPVMHGSNAIILFLLSFAMGITLGWRGFRRSLAAVVLGVLCLCCLNWARSGDFFYGRLSTTFVFARMVEDDLIRPTLRSSCPSVGGPMCEHIDEVGNMTADWYIWSESSPRMRLGGLEQQEAVERRVIVRSLVLFPGRHALAVIRDSWQGIRKLLTDYDPDVAATRVVGPLITTFWPGDAARLQASRQATESWRTGWTRVPLLLTLLAAIVAFPRLKPSVHEPLTGLWITMVSLALLDVAICASLSNVNADRYFSRVNGLVVLTSVTTLACWGQSRLKRMRC